MPYTNADLLESLREKIPTFRCIVGCHDCCGPVTASSEEVARLPVKSDEEHERALTDLTCPYLGSSGCEVYAERPLICRLFGTSPRLPCPNGMRPVYMVDDTTEQAVHRFLGSTRQVLL
ncbi:YkgJ family cysteine cluster protein [Stenotrophomonas sp.]|uniref:YkgJ family cysteine cluster protein n=1 Tax=Stenotrophomonas sp. TaxID=69392 RepID=UPI0028AE1889|nr:YkgJ family cysteine cluster protein [Stenotrophomonas sp.]